MKRWLLYQKFCNSNKQCLDYCFCKEAVERWKPASKLDNGGNPGNTLIDSVKATCSWQGECFYPQGGGGNFVAPVACSLMLQSQVLRIGYWLYVTIPEWYLGFTQGWSPGGATQQGVHECVCFGVQIQCYKQLHGHLFSEGGQNCFSWGKCVMFKIMHALLEYNSQVENSGWVLGSRKCVRKKAFEAGQL